MPSLAKSPVAPVLGQYVPLRGPARMLFKSYAKAGCRPGESTRRLTSKFGDDFEVDFSSFLEWQLWAFGSYEEHFASLFRCLVRPGDRCIDVGANVGVHTVRLAKLVGEHGEVIAFEPDVELVRRARNNILLNHLTNVQLIQAAAAERSGEEVRLYRPNSLDANKGRASLLPHTYLTGSTATVPTACIDDINDGPVALIKIDVEGFESAVVSGAIRTIGKYSPSIIFEYAPELIPSTSSSPFEQLRHSGYELYEVHNNRHRFTGRANLEIERLQTSPSHGTNILAISPPMFPMISSLTRSHNPGISS
jgi:FkbM family methyltransferase